MTPRQERLARSNKRRLRITIWVCAMLVALTAENPVSAGVGVAFLIAYNGLWVQSRPLEAFLPISKTELFRQAGVEADDGTDEAV